MLDYRLSFSSSSFSVEEKQIKTTKFVKSNECACVLMRLCIFMRVYSLVVLDTVYACLCVCLRARARARVCVCVCVRVSVCARV